MERKNGLACIVAVLLLVCIYKAAAFQANGMITAGPTPHRPAAAGRDKCTVRASDRDDDPSSSPSSSVIYKDDCFGLTTFLAGVAAQDVVFTSIFATLSLTADVGTRLGYLPPDPKRPDIVDRKVPGAIAALTLLSTPIVADILLADGAISDVVVDAERQSLARSIQGAICSFSMATAFLDIRWRDRFDYPEE